MNMMRAKERLYLTADKEALVRAGDDAAAFLYVNIGDEIPDSAAEMFGLVDGALPGFVEPSDTPVIDAASAAVVKTPAPEKTPAPAKPVKPAAKTAKAPKAAKTPAPTKEAPATPNKEAAPGDDKTGDDKAGEGSGAAAESQGA